MQSAAGKLGLQLHILQASAEQDFANVFATIAGLDSMTSTNGIGAARS